MTQVSLDCPQCGYMDQVQKVSVLYEESTIIVPQTVIYSTQNGGPRYGTTEKEGHTRLGRELQPPKLVATPGTEEWGVQFVLAIIAVVIIYNLASATYFQSLPLTVWPVIGVWLLLAIVVHYLFRGARVRRREEHERNIAYWKVARETWERLYFCHRCGVVFEPGKALAVPPEEIDRLYE